MPVLVPVAPPLDDAHRAVNEVIGLPLLAPALNATDRTPLEVCTTLVITGAAGLPSITAPDGADAGPVPSALVARTVHV